MTWLSVAIAVACAGLGLWLGTTLADDISSIIVITAACGVLGSFAPVTYRWLAGAAGAKRGMPPR
jgi:hypothetical protein